MSLENLDAAQRQLVDDLVVASYSEVSGALALGAIDFERVRRQLVTGKDEIGGDRYWVPVVDDPSGDEPAQVLANRIRELLADEGDLREKQMFGGLVVLIGGRISVSANRNGSLLVRVLSDEVEKFLKREHVSPMLMSGREMRGCLEVADEGVTTNRQLRSWAREVSSSPGRCRPSNPVPTWRVFVGCDGITALPGGITAKAVAAADVAHDTHRVDGGGGGGAHRRADEGGVSPAAISASMAASSSSILRTETRSCGAFRSQVSCGLGWRPMAVAPAMLTARRLNRAVLARQLLLERARMPLPRAVEQMAGIQNQYAPNAYLRLWSCLDGFSRHDLTRALEKRTVVQATLMRATIHIVSARDFWPLAAAIRTGQRDWWLRVTRPRPEERDLVAAAEEIRTLLADGPLRHDELTAIAGKRWRMLANPWLELVRVPPSGTWEQRRAHLYQTAERWLGPDTASPADAVEHLVRRYLTGFGPASRASIAGWAGLRVGDIAAVVDRLGLRRFVDEEGRELVDLPRAPLPDADTPVPARFLPTWDAALLVHARGAGILPERFRPLVFNTKTPHSVPTFLVDGAVAGSWRYHEGRVELTPFEPLPAAVLDDVEAEAERLADFHS
ncbi:MAG: winged helix DNA-binding domain-containing protein [Acidimicrobiia bacterium]|nr:winged helix DNA-binding domain-containing protein [Acidimicrobiia bacterium]